MQWKRSLAQPCLSFFLSFLFHERPRAAQAGGDDAKRCSATLTIATTLMENAFEIEEGGVKDGRIWRETQREIEEEGDDRRKNKGGRQIIINGGCFPPLLLFELLLTDLFPLWRTGTSANTTRSP